MNPLVLPVTMISAGVATSSYTSNPYYLAGLFRYSIHVKFSDAGLGGTVKLQCSNDPTAGSAPSTADWVDVASSSQSIVAGASYMYNIVDAHYNHVRIVWTPSGGTGTLTAWFVGKYEGN